MKTRIIALLLTVVMLLGILPVATAYGVESEDRGQTRATNNFVGYPSVFVTEDNYRISFLTNANGMAWVEIGGVAYEDSTAGIMDWETKLHGITVPQSVLDSAKSYTICFQPLDARPANNPAPGAKQTKTYSFNPVLPGEDPVLLCVSDQHDNNTGATAVTKYGNFDAVVFGGDYTAAISTEDIANNFLKYSGDISKGTKPVIYPRGNHEIRGQYTHWVDEVMPTSESDKSYYELILGDVYGIVLDCGGSYADNYEDIADTIDYEPYRVEQTRWLEEVYLKGTWKQYSKRVIFSHVPFVTQANFTDIFKDWTAILNRMDMSLLVSGHTHNFTVYSTTHSSVKTSPNFPAFTMTAYAKEPYSYTGTYLTLGDANFTIQNVDSATLSVKATHSFPNKTNGITTEPKTAFETAVAPTPAPASSAGTASIPSVSSPFSAHPTVFMVEDSYQIAFLTTETGMAWVEVGGVKYKDSTMGVMDWESRIHKVTVPKSVLDSAKKYKICFQSMSTRKAYTPVHGATVSRTYPFTPAPASPTFLFMSEQLNDNTNAMKVAAYKNYDVFVCGGKYMKAANTENNRYYLLTLCGETTKGVIPTVFTRGNRELRGFGAHDVIDSMGTSANGEAYFYFTTSNIFGIVLDTGEYGADSLAQFGSTVRFQKYREQQTQWLRELLAEGKWKAYDTRIVICHLPFTAYTDGTMKAVFKEWTDILNEMGVTLMVAGHVNNYSYYPVGDSRNVSGPNFPMLTMSDLDNGDYAYSGTYVTFNGKTFTTENVLSTKKVREKKTVNNPLYVEEPELVSDYAPTLDQNVLYFGFGNNPEDYQRYTENPVYGGANYDTDGVLRTQNFYNGKGAIDFPVADIQNFDYSNGIVRTKINGPYPTQSSYTGCVTRRFVFGETNDTTAAVGSLKFNPANAEVFQVRFKLENAKLRSGISASDAARCVSLQYYKNSNTSAVRNSNSYGGSVVDGKYMTVTLNLDSGFRGAEVITKLWVEFHGFVKSDDSKDAYVTLDYVYIGPKATMPTKDDSYLFFNFTDSSAARYRYASNSYSGYNFDTDTRWNVERKDPANGSTVTVSKSMDMEEGTLNFSFADWDTQVKSTIFGAYQGGSNPLNYNPAKAEVVQVRFKMNNIKAATGANPFIRLWYTRNVNGTNQGTYDNAYSLGNNFVSDGEYMVVTIDLYTQEQINANASTGGFPTTTFAKAGTITGTRIGFHNFTANVAGSPGEIIVDYVYIGPKSDMPMKIYTVNFYDAEGNVLQTNKVNQGERVSFNGTEPVKAPDGENHYTFAGWVAQQGGSTAVDLNNVQADTEAYPYFAPTGHAVAYREAKEATCTEPGFTGDSYCTECGHFIAGGTALPATGHTEVEDPGYAPTCSETGLSDGKHCSVCEEVLVPQEVLPATGHEVVTDVGYEATCSADGLTDGSHCALCGEVLVAQEVIPTTGHHAVAEPGYAPTCTQPGMTEGSFCDRCFVSLVLPQEIPATGHSYTYNKVDELSHKVTCSVCGRIEITSHVFTEGTCVCGEAEALEPVVDPNMSLNHSLNLASDISINFVVPASRLEGYDMSTVYVESTIENYEGETFLGREVVRMEPVLNGSLYYFILTGITAVQMNDTISTVLYGEKNGQLYYSNADLYSVADYAYSQLGKPNSTDTLKTLCADLLRYGAKAQLYKEYRVSSLADEKMTEEHKGYLSDLEAVTFGYNNEDMGDLANAPIAWAGKTLDLDSKVCVKFVFRVNNYMGELKDLSLHVSYKDIYGETMSLEFTELLEYQASAGLYAFSVDALLASELREIISVQIFEGETPVSSTFQYSADTYGNGKSGTLLELCKALFAYSDSAKGYFSA